MVEVQPVKALDFTRDEMEFLLRNETFFSGMWSKKKRSVKSGVKRTES